MSLFIENILWMLILTALSSVIGILLFKDSPKKKQIVILAQISLIIRFVFVFALYSSGTEYSGTDGLIYHQVAKSIANQLRSGVPLWNVEYEYTWYTVMTGVQYALFGVNRYAASFMNCFISVLSGYLLIDIAQNVRLDHKKASLVGIAYLFMPSMIVWTADTRKESMIFFLIILVWALANRALRERERPIIKNLISILSVCVLIWLCTLLRIYLVYTIGCGLFVYFILHYFKTNRIMPFIFSIAILATCLIVTFTTVRSNMNDYHALNMDRTTTGDGNLDKEFESIFSTIIEKNIPGSINGFLTKPHLDEVPHITDIAANPPAIVIVQMEMILWYVCMILCVFGILHALIMWNPYLIGLMVFIVSYGLINALISEDVADTYYRYRAAIVGPLLLYADYKDLFSKIKSLISRSAAVEVDFE